jgi:predicted peptidase
MRNRVLAFAVAVGVAACSGGSGDAPSCITTATCPDTTGGGGGGGGGTVTTGFVSKTFVDAGTTRGYQVFIPANYNSASVTKVPVILFLHGSGEQGTDNVKQTNVGLGPVVKAQAATFPAIVVFPQSPQADVIGNAAVDRIFAAPLAITLAEYTKADTKRVYLTGLSFGGIHAYDVAFAAPTTFAAIVPISAAICQQCVTGNSSATYTQGVQTVVPVLKTVPIWQFHGALDPNVPVAKAREIRDAFWAAGATTTFKYTEYSDGGHEIWDRVYADANMWTWLWAKTK